MKNKKWMVGWFLCLLTFVAIGSSCTKTETYANMKDREKKAINSFIEDNSVVGHINVISEETFNAKGQTTDTLQNEYVLFEDDGIYMQIMRKGPGKTMRQLCEDQIAATNDSSISKVILCKFREYDIENAQDYNTNWNSVSIIDKMLCSYSYKGKSYTASFTEGKMYEKASSSSAAVVPKGWIKPLDYINLAKSAGSGEVARVRLIVPHTSGTTVASSNVLPMYYDITYQLGK